MHKELSQNFSQGICIRTGGAANVQNVPWRVWQKASQQIQSANSFPAKEWGVQPLGFLGRFVVPQNVWIERKTLLRHASIFYRVSASRPFN